MSALKATRSRWTPTQLDVLRTRYADERAEDIARDIGRPIRSVYCKAALLGLSKSADFLSRRLSGRLGHGQGEGSRFKKGHRTWNAGTNFCAGGRSTETRFKPGNKPHTWQPLGAERTTKDGIRQRKVSDTGYPPKDWKSIHSLMWIERHGEIPRGHVVVLRDGDHRNLTYENLELVSRSQLMTRNSVHNLPQPLPALIQLRAALVRKINDRSRRA